MSDQILPSTSQDTQNQSSSSLDNASSNVTHNTQASEANTCSHMPSDKTEEEKTDIFVNKMDDKEVTDMMNDLFERHDDLHSYYLCSAKCIDLTKSEKTSNIGTYKFSHKWLTDPKLSYCQETGIYWLIYSEREHGMFCLLCRRYDSKNEKNNCKVFNTEASVRFRKSTVTDHSSSSQHRSAVNAELMRRISQFEKEYQERKTAKNDVLFKAFYACYFLAKQEIANRKLSSLIEFLEIVGVSEMRFFQHRSAGSIREIFLTVGKAIENSVVSKVRSAESFGILVDDVMDISVAEQMITFISYVSADAKPAVDFLCTKDILEKFTSPNSEAIFRTITDSLTQFNLEISKCMSIVTDGAAVMVGKNNGVAAKLKTVNKKLVSIHCICHRLALACNDSNEQTSYINTVELVLRQLWQYFENSAKRSAVLFKAQVTQRNMNVDKINQKMVTRKVQKACRTRWLSLDKSVQSLIKDFIAITQALRKLDKDNDTAATGLLRKIISGKFVGALYVLKAVLPILSDLSRSFQYSTVNFARIAPCIQAAKGKLNSLVKQEWEEESVTACELKTDLDGKLSASELQYQPEFVDPLLTKYVAALIQNIDNRFDDDLVSIMSSYAIFDPRSVPEKESLSFQTYGDEHIKILADHYYPDDRIQINDEWKNLKYEILSWKKKVKDSEVDITPTEWALGYILSRKTEYKKHYPLLTHLAEIILSIPVSNAWPERGASAVKRIKTRLRSSLKNDMLQALLQISINGPQVNDQEATGSIIEQAVDLWEKSKQRRKLPNLTSDRSSSEIEPESTDHELSVSSVGVQVNVGLTDDVLKALEYLDTSDDSDDEQ